MNSENDLWYLAGVFDGEGCIHIHKDSRHEKTNYSADVTVSMSDITPLQLFQKHFGGVIHTLKQRRNPTRPERMWKQLYQWRLHGVNTKEFLEAMLFRLRVKGQEAALMLLFLETFSEACVPNRILPQSTAELREIAYQGCREIKEVCA